MKDFAKAALESRRAFLVMRMFVRLHERAYDYRLTPRDADCLARLIGRLEYLHFGGGCFNVEVEP